MSTTSSSGTSPGAVFITCVYATEQGVVTGGLRRHSRTLAKARDADHARREYAIVRGGLRVLLVAGVVGVFLAGSVSTSARSLIANCGPRELRATASLEGEAAHVVGGIALRNETGHTCLLPRWPPVSILWHRRALSLAGLPWEDYQPSPRQHEVLLLKPHRWAFMPLLWSNWCGSRPWGRFGFSPTIRLAMWSDTITITPHPRTVAPPPCLSPSHRSTFLFGRFYTPLPAGWIP